MPPTIAVVGAGAVGCYFGGMLARSGADVTLVGRASHMDAIAREGLKIEGVRVRERIPVRATTSLREGLGGADVVLFCVKTVRTESAAREMAPFLKPDATILSLQNGVDNVDRIYSAIGRSANPVVVYVAVDMTAPGVVTHSGRGDLIVDPRGAPLAEVFEKSEIPCRVSESIEIELWTKMAMNCAYNAISALTRARYGRMMEFPEVRHTMESAVAETVEVARAEGVPLSLPQTMEAVYALAGKMSGATSSTAQDIARGRLTEIDSLNGYVVRRGAALGIATPVSEILVTLVKLLEDSAVNSRAG
ncbi:MAG TPA: 2-dehydropantoate 2-reductase [Bryobacteraceae bacterium]|nr:2-dehydropantoate 2-reductase [Bryobacteraceae bacterium]